MATTIGNRARALALSAAVLLAGIVFLLLLRRTGELAIPLVVVAVGAAILLLHPGWTLALTLVSAVAFENTAQGGTFPIVPAFYDVAVFISPFEMLVALLVAGYRIPQEAVGFELLARSQAWRRSLQ